MLGFISDQTMAYQKKATAINGAVAVLHFQQAELRTELVKFSSQRKHTLKSCFMIPTWGFQIMHNYIRAAYFLSTNMEKQLNIAKKSDRIKGLIQTSEEFAESDIFVDLEKLNKP